MAQSSCRCIPCHATLWQSAGRLPPAPAETAAARAAAGVSLHAAQGVHEEVAAELRGMGAHVMDGSAPLEPQFPPRPPPLAYANLDVTTMCALVAEVANGGAEGGGSPEVLAWAARISHWVDSVAAEAADPLMPHLMAAIQVRRPAQPSPARFCSQQRTAGN